MQIDAFVFQRPPEPLDEDVFEVEHGNAARGIPLLKQKGEGREPWPNDVQAEFEAVASPRALPVRELCVGTGQRIGDGIKMHRDHFKDSAYDFTQSKTYKPLWIPLTDRLPAQLATIDKKVLTLITGAKGQPVNYRAIADDMRKIKGRLQHPDAKAYVTHGLRKNATIERYLAV